MSEEPTFTERLRSDATVAQEPDDNAVVKIGILYAEEDHAIAERFMGSVRSVGYGAEFYNFYDCGVSKLAALDKFIERNNVIFWLATETSLKADKLLEHMRYTAQHAAITSSGRALRFVTVQPKEYLKLHLPTGLAAYTPLREEPACFVKKLEKTLASVKKQLIHMKSGAVRSLAGADSDGVGQESLQVDEPAETLAAANPGPLVEEVQQNDGTAGRDTALIQNIFNITMNGPNASVQIDGERGQQP